MRYDVIPRLYVCTSVLTRLYAFNNAIDHRYRYLFHLTYISSKEKQLVAHMLVIYAVFSAGLL